MNLKPTKRHLVVLIVISLNTLLAQDMSKIKWWKPMDSPLPTVDGRYWSDKKPDTLVRFPQKIMTSVRKPVWDLSQNSAGLFIRFMSNASQIIVRYQVSGHWSMPHMPATGVSGVDLYAIDSDGNWHYCAGKYFFQDTVTYRFEHIKANDGYHKLGREYRLFLPLYNTVHNLEIGVPTDAYFQALPKMAEKPIVVYGTSIAQGACASRPGMAWTNILNRKLDRSIINLGFSGNGQMEKELIDVISEIEAEVYVFDCLPNMISNYFEISEFDKRILSSVRSIRKKHPKTPILLTEHAGYTEARLMPERQNLYEEVNKKLNEDVELLRKEGISGIHVLSRENILLDMDAMVDGTHPNDYGMMQYAEAYEKKLREIMSEPKGSAKTQIPVRQRREPDSYDWEARHCDILNATKTEKPKIIFIGNSITHNWGGKPFNKRIIGMQSWQKYLEPKQVLNLGFGWDRIENVLWRIYHGELDNMAPEKIIVNIGTNNLHINSDEDIVEGLKMLIQAIKVRQPGSKIYLLGIYPRRALERRIAGLNNKIKAMSKHTSVYYKDIGINLLGKSKKINEKLFSDGLHPNSEGYEILGKSLSDILKE
jgi:lysophospholipase L1-like esterase